MEAFYQQLSNLLTTAPGNLTYHIVILFSLVWAFQTTFNLWLNERSNRLQRMMIGFCFLLALRIILFTAAFIGYNAPEAFLPPSERAVTTISLIIIIWLWAFPDGSRMANIITILTSLFFTIFLAISITIWYDRSKDLPFNATLLNTTWEASAALISLIGCILLIIRRPEYWGAGFGMLGLNLLGHVATTLYPESNGDYSGIVRLVQIASYPILFTLTQRMPTAHRKRTPPSPDIESEISAAVSLPTESRLLSSFFEDLLTLEDSFLVEDWNNVIQFICQTMQSEYGLILSTPNEEDNMSILGEYPINTAEERTDILNTKQIPLLSNALQRGRGLILSVENNSQDLINLKAVLKTANGNILAAPIAPSEQNIKLGVILFNTEKGWTGDHLAEMISIGHVLGKIQARSDQTPISKIQPAPERERDISSILSNANLDLTQMDEAFRAILVETQAANKELAEALKAARDEAAKIPILLQREKELKAILSKAQTQLKENKTALDKAKQDTQKISELIIHEKELDEIISNLQVRVDTLNQEAARIQAFEQNERELRTALSEAKAQAQTFEQNERELQAALSEAKAQAQTFEQNERELQAALTEAKAQMDHYHQMASNLEQEMNSQIQSLTQQAGEKDAQILSLQTNQQQLELDHKSKLGEIEAALKEQAELHTKESNQQIERFQKQLQTAITKAKEQDTRKTQEINRLEKELRVALASVDKIKNHLSQSEQLAIETREQINQLSSQQMTEVASAAQELRHPLSAIVDYSDLLLDESVGALGALQRKFLEKIKESIKNLEDRVNNLIQSTVLDSSKVHLFSHTVDVKSILDTALEIADTSIKQKKLHVYTLLPQEMPMLLTDREAIQQILLYLIHHAAIATPPNGKINITFRLETKEEQKHILMQVSDSGEGIPQEELPQVFSPLYRPSRYAASDGDVEMGLSIAKTLVDALKGRIWVDSTENKGSTFSVYLPVVIADTDGQVSSVKNK